MGIDSEAKETWSVAKLQREIDQLKHDHENKVDDLNRTIAVQREALRRFYPRVIGLGCQARVGKDTVANYLELHSRGKYIKLSFAGALKEGVREFFGFSRAQTDGDLKEVVDPHWGMTPRKVLQLMGTEVMRKHFGEDFWVKRLALVIENRPDDRFVISDCRFPQEVEAIKNWGGKVFRIFRPGAQAVGGVEAHSSETALLDWTGWDAVIANDGTLDELYAKVDRLLLGQDPVVRIGAAK